jgi:predicted deacylase
MSFIILNIIQLFINISHKYRILFNNLFIDCRYHTFRQPPGEERCKNAVMYGIIEEQVTMIGVTPVSIRILECGTGNPTLSIITGIHGDETSSLLVVAQLLERFDGKGTLRIILGANQIALHERSRMSSIDSMDLNRSFGSSERTVTALIAERLIMILEGSDAVIDLHSFTMETPLLGIIVQSDLDTKNRELLASFRPTQAWLITRDEQRFGGVLGGALSARGVPNIAIELNRPECVTQEEIDACVDGILRVQSSAPAQPLHCLIRERVLAPGGVFIPTVRPLETVKRGQVLGKLHHLPRFNSEDIASPTDGILMQIARHGLVMPGEEIAAIGRREHDTDQ